MNTISDSPKPVKDGSPSHRRADKLRRDHTVLTAAGTDFYRQWRDRSQRKRHDCLSRDILITGVCLITLVVLALMIDASAAGRARHLSAGWYSVFAIITGFGQAWYIFLVSGITCLVAAAASRLAAAQDMRTAMGVLAGRAAYIFLVLTVSGIAAQVLKRIGRARPKFMDQGGPFQFDPLMLKASWASFPSGHTITAFASAMALGYLLPKWRVPLLAAAVLIGVSRIVLGAHYPSDVFGGACIGIASAVLLRRAFAARAIVFVPREQGIAVRGRGLIVAALRNLFRS